MSALAFDPHAALAAARGGPCEPAKAANPAKVPSADGSSLAALAGLAVSSGPDDLAERAAIIADGTGWPEAAARAFAIICTMAPPPSLSDCWPSVTEAIGRAFDAHDFRSHD